MGDILTGDLDDLVQSIRDLAATQVLCLQYYVSEMQPFEDLSHIISRISVDALAII